MKSIIRKVIVKYIPEEGMTEREGRIVRGLAAVLVMLILAAIVTTTYSYSLYKALLR
jgi:hypothetical protein